MKNLDDLVDIKNMSRIDKIINNDTFIRRMKEITDAEKSRIFCCHGIDHTLDVARIAYIISLEKSVGIRKDVIYAAALLHDIGRWSDIEKDADLSHAEAGACIAEGILMDAGFSDKECASIVKAIRQHGNDPGEGDFLSWVIYIADKKSRRCYSCKAYDECFWDEDLKNKGINI